MNPNPAGMAVTALSVLLGFGWISSGHSAEADSGGANNAANAPNNSLSQVTETPTPALADLQVGWHADHWWDGCSQRSQPRILGVSVTNLGGAAAGPFVVRDGRVMWQAPGLAAGARWSVTEWGPYALWPLEVDPYDQVPESNEDNNVAGPSPNATWSPTPEYRSDRGTPRAGIYNQPVSPAPVMTLPVFCTPATPVPTLTPSGDPPLPNLYVVSARWDRLAIQVPGAAGPCLPADDPWTFELTIGNSGGARAGWFSVGGSGAVWRITGLDAGQTMTLRSQPRFLPQSITVDQDDWVEESREDDNGWTLAQGGTPTPVSTPPPVCSVPTSTGSETPTITATPTPTPTASTTRSATPTESRRIFLPGLLASGAFP